MYCVEADNVYRKAIAKRSVAGKQVISRGNGMRTKASRQVHNAVSYKRVG